MKILSNCRLYATAGLLLLHSTRAWLTSSSHTTSTQQFSFALQAGFGKTTAVSKKAGKKKKGGLIAEIEASHDAPASKDKGPVLDKWGLPMPTADDIFPPLPPSTELISASKEAYSLTEIQEALRDYIPMDLVANFDETGIERDAAPKGRLPMQVKLVHVSPPVLLIDNFMTAQECLEIETIMHRDSEAVSVDSQRVSSLATSRRTSTSWFCHYHQVSTLLAKAHYRLGFALESMEEPQVVRYAKGQEFTWHYDEVPPSELSNGGQRLATLLVYLNTVSTGGGTVFRDLQDGNGNMLTVQPRQGSALLFFPAKAGGQPDDRTLHKGEVAEDEKRIVQMWIHQGSYRAGLPAGNSQEKARERVEKEAQRLGYI
jgi:prolyl 4-hydroxylase